eukprot:381922-Rhodomonas_salina.4
MRYVSTGHCAYRTVCQYRTSRPIRYVSTGHSAPYALPVRVPPCSDPPHSILQRRIRCVWPHNALD